jgi:hypothetical protein
MYLSSDVIQCDSESLLSVCVYKFLQLTNLLEKANIEMSLHSFPVFDDYLTNLPEDRATVPLDKLCPEVYIPSFFQFK